MGQSNYHAELLPTAYKLTSTIKWSGSLTPSCCCDACLSLSCLAPYELMVSSYNRCEFFVESSCGRF